MRRIAKTPKQRQKIKPSLLFLGLLLCTTLFVACDHFNTAAKKASTADSSATNTPNTITSSGKAAFDLTAKPTDTVAYINELSARVIESLHNRDILRFSNFVHPQKGVLFAPSLSVDPSMDLNLKAKEIKKALSVNKEKVYEWGKMMDGEPLRLTFADYYKQYIYDKPYRNATRVNYNKVLANGAQRSNAKKVFPEAIIVEHFKVGNNPDFGGLDWGSLVTVFEYSPDEKQWFLVGLLHGQWAP